MRNELSICNETDLTSDDEFMSKQRIIDVCECSAKTICCTIAEKLANKEGSEAFCLLSDLYDSQK